VTSFEVWRRLQQHQTVRPLPTARGSFREFSRKLMLLFMVILMVSGVAAVLGVLVYKGLSHSSFFQITGIKIEGCRRTTKEMVLELSGVDIHSNLMALDLQVVKEHIEEHGWIEQAKVDRLWPNELVITIYERNPVAMINLEGGLYYLDRHGVVFAEVEAPADLDFPVITGLEDRQPSETGEVIEEALRFIASSSRGNPALPKQNISELHVDAKGDFILFLVDRPLPIYLGRGEMATKYSRLTRVLTWLYRTGTFSDFAYIDMGYEKNRVLVGTRKAG
jgi:cell division protein FtsQ